MQKRLIVVYLKIQFLSGLFVNVQNNLGFVSQVVVNLRVLRCCVMRIYVGRVPALEKDLCHVDRNTNSLQLAQS